jgi:integrase
VGLRSLMRSLVEFVTVDATGETVERAKTIPKKARTLADFWTMHHVGYLADGHPNTKRQSEYAWRAWLEPALGHLTWAELKPQAIAQVYRGWIANGYIRHEKERGKLAPQTIGNLAARLSGILSHAVSLEYLEANPCTAARRYLPDTVPSARNKDRPQRLTLDEARLLITSPLIEQVYRDEYAAAIYLCTRRGELHGLRWKCVALDAATPTVRIERSYNLGTKTGVVRTVPIHPELQPILRRMRDERKPAGEDLVFPNKRGRMQAKNADHFYRSRDLLGLPDCVVHGLRKTGGTLYRAAGVPKTDVADILGHARSVTDVYAPVQHSVLLEKMKALSIIGVADVQAVA